jgi:hypothetical protein
MDLTAQILKELDGALSHLGFRRRTARRVLACWVLRKLSYNRAVVVIECPSSEDPAVFAREQKSVCRKAAGFFIPFFYEVGLQIVVLGPAAITDPKSVVDAYSNQICVLQSVYVVDLAGRSVTSGATWGQTVTRPIQEVVASALRYALVSTGSDTIDRGDSGSEQLVPAIEPPQPLRRSVEVAMQVSTWCTILTIILLVLKLLSGR